MTLLWVGLGIWIGLLLGSLVTATALTRSHEGRVDRIHDTQAEERAAWVVERRDLNNRIQVPEAAPFMSEAPSRQHVPYDDDAAFQAAQEETPEWP